MLRCQRCDASGLASYSHLIAHLVTAHSNEPDFSMNCTLQHKNDWCCAKFCSWSSYKSHLYRFHYDLVVGRVSETRSVCEILCRVCSTMHKSLRAIAAHYRVHCSNGMTVPCLVKDCNSAFDVFSSYTSHMARKHRSVCYENLRDDCKQASTVAVESFDDDSTEMPSHSSVETMSASMNVDIASLTRNMALFCLKLKTKYSIPDCTVQLIMDDFSDTFELSTNYLKSKIHDVCSKHALSAEVVRDMNSAVENGLWKQATDDLATDWKRNTYYKNNFQFVAPVTMQYVENCDSADSFQYIPLRETLSAVLHNEQVRNQLHSPRCSIKGHLMSFTDGHLYKQHPVFSTKQSVLQLVIFSDEFLTVNPLGPHNKKCKIMAFYLLINNLHSLSKSHKTAIFLLALCKSAHTQKYGLTRVAEVICNDIQLLETEGLDVEGFTDKVYGSLAFIAGDNLNSHMIGGFNCSFSPNVLHPCRYCTISNADLQTTVCAEDLNLRTRIEYDAQTSEVLADASKSTVYGVRYRSPFIVGSFHVVDGLPPDIMHDLLEGVVPFELALVLRHLLSNGVLTLDELNFVIDNWEYGPLDKVNKPVALSTSFGDCIKQNAGRTWCLLRLLPLMIGPKIKADSACIKYWQFLLQLKDIVEVVFAPQLAIGHVIHLKAVIEDHIIRFKQLFPDKSLKPKHHFLLHYAHCFFVYGPLRSCWCMRFESKHYYFTHLMTLLHNYKNACSTLAQRHQMKLAYELSTNNFLAPDLSFSSVSQEDLNYLADYVIEELVKNGVIKTEPLHKCNKHVCINGVKYYNKMYVLLRVTNDVPLLGRIDGIYLQHMKCHFLLRICLTEFNPHFGAYCVQPTDDIAVSCVDNLLDYYPLTGYVVQQQRYVSLKNFVYDHSVYTCLH